MFILEIFVLKDKNVICFSKPKSLEQPVNTGFPKCLCACCPLYLKCSSPHLCMFRAHPISQTLLKGHLFHEVFPDLLSWNFSSENNSTSSVPTPWWPSRNRDHAVFTFESPELTEGLAHSSVQKYMNGCMFYKQLAADQILIFYFVVYNCQGFH